MGRTNPTFRDTLRALEDRWSDYRRALRRGDQPYFDRLFTHAREHADASGLLNHQDPMAPVLVSIALEQQRAIERLQSRVETLEATVEPAPDESTGEDDY
ncbi:hypothetical protein [Halosimplex carlsbadense]|nr:hypothetical protein [Halosimplex carlsbadense]